MVKEFNEISSNYLQLGMKFSAPLFFDDGENMFLAEGKSIKKYHLNALKLWHIEYLLTYGHVLLEDEEIEELEAAD